MYIVKVYRYLYGRRLEELVERHEFEDYARVLSFIGDRGIGGFVIVLSMKD